MDRRLDFMCLLGALCLMALNAGPALAGEQPLLAPVFTDNAVLQHGQAAAIWGQATPGARIAARIDGRVVRRGRAEADGAWMMRLPPQKPGADHTLDIISGETVQTLSNIAFGDVFLCSGQSNMEFQLRVATNANYELSQAARPNVRLFHVPRRIADDPQSGFEAPLAWSPSSPESAAGFSAVCYFLGVDFAEASGRPVGLIDSTWGGTRIEAWMPESAIAAMPELADLLALQKAGAADPAAADRAYADRFDAWWRAQPIPDEDKQTAFSAEATDEGFAPISVDDFWETSGEASLRDFDGVVLYRKRFNLSKEQANLGGVLRLGRIDDADITYLNGRRLGVTYGYNVVRSYDVTPDMLVEGENIITVGVLDTGGGGGIWGAPALKDLKIGDETIALSDGWLFRKSAGLSALDQAPSAPRAGANALSVLYNGMIAPLAPYTMSGVAWYQGESNVGNAADYEDLTVRWIKSWRDAFNNASLAFFVTQLADYGAVSVNEPVVSGWAQLREAQRQAMLKTSRAEMAVTHDIGDRYDIHPTQKKIVALRLSRHARAMLLGEDIVSDGPAPKSVSTTNGAVRIDFENGPLAVYGFDRPIGFELCDRTGECEFVDATVEGDSVLLAPEQMTAPDKVRFCWADAPVCNLYNNEDLPATPFEMMIKE